MSYEGVAQLATLLEDIAEASTRLAWPNARYSNDIEGFARDILGFDSTWDGQRRIYASVQQPRSSTVVRARSRRRNAPADQWFTCPGVLPRSRR